MAYLKSLMVNGKVDAYCLYCENLKVDGKNVNALPIADSNIPSTIEGVGSSIYKDYLVSATHITHYIKYLKRN